MKSRSSSISPAAANAPASIGPPSSISAVISRRPSSASAATTRSAGSRPATTTSSAPALSSAASAVGVGAGADDDQQRRLVDRADQLRVERQAGLGVEDHPRRLARRRSTSRAVSSGSSASAVPIPTATASASARQRWTSVAAPLAGDPLRVAAGGGDEAVERGGHLQRHQRAAGAGVLSERLVEQPRRGGLLAGRLLDLDAAVAQHPGPAPGGLLARIVGRVDDARRSRPRGSPPRREAGGRCERRARASRTSSPRPGPRRGRGSPRAPRARRADRRARHDSPRRSAPVADDHGADERVGLTPPRFAWRPAPAPAPSWASCSVAASWLILHAPSD